MPRRRTKAPVMHAVDRDELARLYDRHAPGLYRYALMVLMDHGLAEDAVQQVFSKLLASGIAGIASPDHYLRRAVRNECLTLGERRPRHSSDRAILENVSVGDTGATPDERLMLEAALRALPVEQREVVVLKVYEGLTFSEIATVVDAPLNTVASRYRYAVQKLKSILIADGCSQ